MGYHRLCILLLYVPPVDRLLATSFPPIDCKVELVSTVTHLVHLSSWTWGFSEYSLNAPAESVTEYQSSNKASCFQPTALIPSFVFDKTKKCYCRMSALHVTEKPDSIKRIDLPSPV